MSDQEDYGEQEWDLDTPSPNSEDYDCEIADDSLGDTDYPESDDSSDQEEKVDKRTKAYRNRHTGYLYYQRNPHRRYEEFSKGDEEFSDRSDGDEGYEDYEDEESDYSENEDYDEEESGDSEADVDMEDEQFVRRDNVADAKTMSTMRGMRKGQT